MTNCSQPWRFPLLAAGILGLLGVALGALGAHALKPVLTDRGTQAAWDTAAKYHLLHAVAMLAAAAWMRAAPLVGAGRMRWGVRCWCTGIALFSGSLYWLALGGPRWLGPVTPLGGLALMAGWLLAAAAALSRDPPG
jgi:uncharacterized membrane protein YgdD (TMEM256/DUF423 family)